MSATDCIAIMAAIIYAKRLGERTDDHSYARSMAWSVEEAHALYKMVGDKLGTRPRDDK